MVGHSCIEQGWRKITIPMFCSASGTAFELDRKPRGHSYYFGVDIVKLQLLTEDIYLKVKRTEIL
jgi:hypothetical protein